MSQGLKTPPQSTSEDEHKTQVRRFVGELAVTVGQPELGPMSVDQDFSPEEQAIERRRTKSEQALEQLGVLIKEHESARNAERAVFFGLDVMDDVFARADQLVTQGKKTAPEVYGPMLQVYERVESRRSRIYSTLPDVVVGILDDQTRKVHQRATTLAAGIRGIDGPLPGDFESQQEKVVKRLRTLSQSDEQKRELRQEVERAGESQRGEERELFKKTLESVGLRQLDRLDAFDPHVVALDRDTEKLLVKQFEAARDRYLKVLDTGGTTAEAELQLDHIPKAWWPPAFVKEVQAWRLIERKRREQAVQNLLAEADRETKGDASSEDSSAKKIDNAIGKLASVTAKVGDKKGANLKWVGIVGKDAEKVAQILNEVTTAFKTLQTLTPGVDFAMEFEEFKEKNSNEKVEKVAEAVGEFGEKVESALGAAEKISEAAKELVEGFVGPVVIAAGIAKFIQGCARMKNIGDAMQNTANLVERAEIEAVLGEREDGGAIVRSMENSRTNQKVKLAKAAIETVDAALQVAEGAVDTAGQAHAKYGIQIARKVITLGSKVAFAEVDFRQARQAMRTLRDAQAGSMAAQQQIFEDSTYFAMSYLAHLVEQGDPIADSFARRGLVDVDLKKKEISTAILVEVLQKAAGASNVAQQGSETRGEAIQKVAQSGYDAVKEKWTEFSDRYFPGELPGSAGTEYDPGWKHSPADVVLAEGYWMATRKRAIDEAGLFDHDERLPANLDVVATAFQRLGIRDAAQWTARGLQEAARTATETSPLRQKQELQATVDALEKCRAGILAYDAFHTPSGPQQQSGPHAGFVAYQAALAHEINACENFLEAKLEEPAWLVGTPARDFSWKPPKAISLDAASFQRHWTEACKRAWLEDVPPSGVVGALNRVSGAVLARTGRETKASKDARAMNKEYFDALAELTREIDKAWPDCQHAGLKNYLLTLKLDAAKKAREMDQRLNELGTFRIKNAAFTADAWHETYADARERGAADSIGDVAKKLSASLTAWAEAEKKIRSSKVTDQILGRTDGLVALKDVNLNAVQAGLAIGSTIMSDHCASIAETAKAKLKELDEQNNQATFAWEREVYGTSAGFPKVYQAAVDGGVIVASAKLRDGVTNGLKEVERLLERLSAKEVTPKERRAAAAEAVKAIERLDGALRTLRDDRGHRNQHFQALLAAIAERLDAIRNGGILAAVLSGERGGDFQPALPRSLDLLNWSGTGGAKFQAVDAGILENDKDDTLDQAIIDSHRYMELFSMQSGGINVSPKELIETKRLARESLGKLKTTAGAQRTAVQHEGYQNYMQAWIGVAEEYAKRLSESDAYKEIGEFNPPRFAYSDENWQRAKAQAVGFAILDDVRTNVGKFLTESDSEYKTLVELRKKTPVDPEALENARQTASAKIRQAMGSVAKVRKLSKVKNDKWERYLDQAVQAIQERYDDCARTTSAFEKFDLTLPRHPTLLDWQRAQELAVRAGILASTRDEAMGRAISDADTKTQLFLAMAEAIGVSPTEAKSAYEEARGALETLRSAARVERSKSTDEGFQKFVDQWSEFATRQTELAGKRYAANFT